MAFADVFPAPMARIIVAAPVTASPPAKTSGFEVAPCSSIMMHPRLFVLRPFVVFLINGFGVCPIEIIAVSIGRMCSEPFI